MSQEDEKMKIKEVEVFAQDIELDDTEVQDVNDIHNLSDFIVPQTDDPSTPTFTVRTITIGTVRCVFLSVINTLLSFRTNVFRIGANVALILSYPIGLAWHAAFPKGGIPNPGPFNVKEHKLIYIPSSCGAGTLYGLQVLQDFIT
ncbi:hypothetical protein HK100_004325 [Physocladia obscura]|uniref:Uncharacterized protein n=1 Tax=Physocladia obscura TaxID=109957 RepID=A0AAD5XKZ1_9FUNG|nr:hypothetical protein HK100_004325 [Physocladia obscura]